MTPAGVQTVVEVPIRTRRIRIGVTCASGRAPRWLVRSIEKLEREQIVELVSIRCVSSDERGADGVLGWLDTRLSRRMLASHADAWTPTAFDASSAAEGSRAELTIELETSSRAPAAPSVWTVRFGESATRHRAEFARGDELLSIAIVTADEHGRERRLASTETAAARSLTLSRSRAGWKAGALLERSLRDFAAGRDATARANAADDGASPRPRRGSWLSSAAVRIADRFARRSQWRVAWRARSAEDPELPDDRRWTPDHELVPPPGRFYADPFLLEHEGREHLFFEDFEFATGLGRIACAELAADGTPGTPRVVLCEDAHLSYPFVFEHEGRAFMIPETRSRRTIELWSATRFPWEWALDRVLLGGVRAVDATWFRHAGLFWIFAGSANDHAPLSEELHAWWSAQPFGPWTPHEGNPIVDDPRCARPAGRPFWTRAGLVRPAQDVVGDYGRRVVFRGIRVLDPTRYEERTLATFEARWLSHATGAHTFDRSSRSEVVDARVRRWRNPFARVRGAA